MKFNFIQLVLILISIAMVSCSNNSNVVSNNLIQKRKHTKGFYWGGLSSRKSNLSRVKIQEKEEKLIVNYGNLKLDSESTNHLVIKFDTILESFESENEAQFESVKFEVGAKNTIEIGDSHESTILIPIKKHENKLWRTKQDEGSVSAAATISFFASILGWVALVGIIPASILGFWIIALGLLLTSLILEAIAYFLSSSDSNIRSSEIANKISGYYWYFMATMLTVSLGSIIFII